MIKGKTESGFEFEIEESRLDNMELVDAVAEASDESPITVSRVILLLLGEKQRKALYDFCRAETGNVPIEAVSRTIIEIFKSIDSGKNS